MNMHTESVYRSSYTIICIIPEIYSIDVKKNKTKRILDMKFRKVTHNLAVTEVLQIQSQ